MSWPVRSTLAGILFCLPLAFAACKSRTVQSRPTTELGQHRKIAVTSIQINLIEEKGCVLFSDGLKTGEVAIEDYAVDVIHKNLLEKGFVPIERRRIKHILREQGLGQTGMYEQTQIGALAGASAIFTGNISIRTELEHHPHIATAILFPPSLLYRLVVPNAKTTLTFSGRMTSVETSAILISGEIANKEEGFEMDMVRELIDEWFEDVESIKENDSWTNKLLPGT